MDKEQILYATGATMLMCIVALLLFVICRSYRKKHKKKALINMALKVLNETFPRIIKIDYRTAECIPIRDRGEKAAVLFETCDWYGYRESFLESVYPEDQERVRTFTSLEHMRRVWERELVSDTCIYKKRENGVEYHWMQMIIIPAGEPGCVMIYARNVDESVRAGELYKEQLWEMLQKSRRAEASKTEFLRYMCHDLRIPLNEMLELNALVRENIEQEKVHRVGQYLARIEGMGQYLLTMLNDIFQVSIFREWRVRTSRMPFSLPEVLHNCHDYCLDNGMAYKNITFKMELDENLKQQYNGDGSRLTQLLNALLSNACKFNCEGGSVLLKAWLADAGTGWDEIAVSVCDTGCGIPREQLAAIQRLFAQDRRVPVKMGEGIGIGFFFVKRALDAIDGRIQSESTEGRGSCFTVRLKLEHVRNSDEGARDNLKVLVVDDNEMHREIASEILSVNSFHPVSCSSGEQALRVFRESEPGTFDVVLTDIEMPEMDGHQLASEIRSSDHADGKRIWIIALSAHDNEEERGKALQSGMDKFLSKPFQVGEFKQILEELII